MIKLLFGITKLAVTIVILLFLASVVYGVYTALDSAPGYTISSSNTSND